MYKIFIYFPLIFCQRILPNLLYIHLGFRFFGSSWNNAKLNSEHLVFLHYFQQQQLSQHKVQKWDGPIVCEITTTNNNNQGL